MCKRLLFVCYLYKWYYIHLYQLYCSPRSCLKKGVFFSQSSAVTNRRELCSVSKDRNPVLWGKKNPQVHIKDFKRPESHFGSRYFEFYLCCENKQLCVGLMKKCWKLWLWDTLAEGSDVHSGLSANRKPAKQPQNQPKNPKKKPQMTLASSKTCFISSATFVSSW